MYISLFYHLMRYSSILAIYMFSFSAKGQTNDCSENAASFANQVAEFLENDDETALTGILFLWEQQCGLTEPIYRVRTLQQIRKGSWNLDNGKELLEQALNFKIRNDLVKKEDIQNLSDYFDFYPEVFGFVPLTSQLDTQTSHLAHHLLNQNRHDSIVNLVLNLYAGNTDYFFEKLKNGFASRSSLGIAYQERVENLVKKPEWIVGIHAGTWIPSAKLAAVGTHPTLGFLLGGKKGKISLQSSFEFRFGKTPRDVFIVVKDTLTATRNYQGGSLGLYLSYDFFKKHNHHMTFFAGVGLDVLDLVENSLQEPERITFLSPELRMGLQYNISFANRSYLSLSAGFSLLNHLAQLAESTQLTGNAVNLKLIFGFRNNPSKTENLYRMGIRNW